MDKGTLLIQVCYVEMLAQNTQEYRIPRPLLPTPPGGPTK